MTTRLLASLAIALTAMMFASACSEGPPTVAAFNFDDVAVTPIEETTTRDESSAESDETSAGAWQGATYSVELPESWNTISSIEELDAAIADGTVDEASHPVHGQFFRQMLSTSNDTVIAVSPDQRDAVMVWPVRNAGITFTVQDPAANVEALKQLQRDQGRPESQVNATVASYGGNDGLFSKSDTTWTGEDPIYYDYQFTLQDHRGVHTLMVLLASGPDLEFAEEFFSTLELS